MHHIGRAAMAGAVAALIGATGCTSEPDATSDAQTPDQARAQFRAEARRLTLAPGWEWPTTPEGMGILDTDPDDGAGNMYSPGYGTSWANDYWFCSWKDRILDRDISAEQREAALVEARKIRLTHRYRKAVDENGKKHIDDMLSSAELGDLSPIRSAFRMNCKAADEQ